MRWFNMDPENQAHQALYRKAIPAQPRPEETEQRFVIQWAQSQEARWPDLELLYHIGNSTGYRGGFRQNKGAAGQAQAMGVRPGVSDLHLPVPMPADAPARRVHFRDQRGNRSIRTIEGIQIYHGLWIEMKVVCWRPNPKKPGQIQLGMGEVSDEQMRWLKRMSELGHAVTVSWGREEGQRALEEYLSGRWIQRLLVWLAAGAIETLDPSKAPG